jgi:hypothetical protein
LVRVFPQQLLELIHDNPSRFGLDGEAQVRQEAQQPLTLLVVLYALLQLAIL